ncbi:alpha/beta fold hydrolase [Rhizobium rhizogenes]|uniref:alpha/beta fold hydrolase n=1 Tax=Rhizobium rhizogenes TaxID=359 RepID=UPI0015740FDF|nr:alpha/beta hydrolase [Rhizobium rhizogenes]NTH21850.1 alpha/beta hydrolase [Rhizobium rhizogenes]NTH34993.1 alpha/beta hydrolase [Rhizobium rhizogenes]
MSDSTNLDGMAEMGRGQNDLYTSIEIDRGFVRVAEGQIHFRTAGPAVTDRIPIVLFHSSPASSLTLKGLIERFGRDRRVYAIDTLGNGDSAPPSSEHPDIAYFADAHLRAMDALGLEMVDLYGIHTGGCIAVEIAIREPKRVRSVILDGLSFYSDTERADLLERYAPAVPLDQSGSQINWFWHFVRDGYLFWPWYERNPTHARTDGLPPAGDLHDKLVEVLKAARTYHLSYNAAIAWSKKDRLPLLRVRTLLAYAEDDAFLKYRDPVVALMPKAEAVITEGVKTAASAEKTTRRFKQFLDAIG